MKNGKSASLTSCGRVQRSPSVSAGDVFTPLLIVLTDNAWLHMGLSALLPEMCCLRMRPAESRLSPEVTESARIIVVVDSLVFLRGELSAYHTLQAWRPDATVIWLTRMETGRVFPVQSRGDRILEQKGDIAVLGHTLRRISHHPALHVDDDYITPVRLTQTERRLLPYFMKGVDVSVLSKITGSPVKTLYHHRQKIMLKTGFRQMVFLQFVYALNHSLDHGRGIDIL